MYFRVLHNNFKKTFQDYAIYFATLVICAALFFAFLSLTSTGNYILRDNTQYSWSMFQDTIKYTIYGISLAFLVLINHVNKHMLHKRAKEFSMYIILGMERSKVAGLFLMETLSIGLLAVVAGCVVGTLLSGVLTGLVFVTITGVFSFHLGLYWDTFYQTVLLFFLVFCVIGIFNSRKLAKTKLVDLLVNDKTTEGEKIDKRWYMFATILTFLCFIFTAYVLYDYFSYGRGYVRGIPSELSNSFQTAAGVSLILGIFTGYYTISYIFVFLKNRVNCKYNRLNLVLLNNLYSKISSNAKVMAVATIAIVVSITGFILAPILANIVEGFFYYRMPYDIMIYNHYTYIDSVDDIPHIDYSFVDEILNNNAINVKEICQQESYFIWDKDFKNSDARANKWDFPRLSMRISDYNQMRQMSGYLPVEMGEEEFFMHIDYETDKDSILATINTKKLRLDNGAELFLTEEKIYNDPLGSYLFNRNNSDVLVFPDSVCDQLQLATTGYYANTTEKISYELCRTLEDEIKNTFREDYSYLYTAYESKYKSDENYTDFIDPTRFKTLEKNDTLLATTSIRLLGIYIGIVFFIMCLTVLALQQLTDSIENKSKYAILYKMGVEQKAIRKLIFNQISIYFGIPCVVAIVSSGIFLYTFLLRFGHKVDAYIGNAQFAFNVLIPVVMMLIILLGYFVATVYSYWHNIEGVFRK